MLAPHHGQTCDADRSVSLHIKVLLYMHRYTILLRTSAFRDIPREKLATIKLSVVDMRVAWLPCRKAALKISYM